MRHLSAAFERWCANVPSRFTALVVSKGDPELLTLYGRKAWHSRARRGGLYRLLSVRWRRPLSHISSISRSGGADFLVLPDTRPAGWLDHYPSSGITLNDGIG